MRFPPKVLPLLAAGAVIVSLSTPSPAYAQQAPGVVQQQAPVLQQAPGAVQQQAVLPPALLAAVNSGNADRIIAQMTTAEINNPAMMRALAEAIGRAEGGRGQAAMFALVEKVTSSIADRVGAAQSAAVFQGFGAGMTLGLSRSAPGQAAQMIQAATSAMVSGAGKNEARLGEVARAVSSGVVESLVLGNVVPVANIANMVQVAVSQGASKVVGSSVTVQIESSDNKPVVDVTLVRQDGRALDKGRDIGFIEIGSKSNKPEEKRSENASPS